MTNSIVILSDVIVATDSQEIANVITNIGGKVEMTDANLARHAKSPWLAFWTTLKQGYDYFEQTRLLPEVAVCQRQYVVNVKLPGSSSLGRIDPEGACPTFERPKFEAFTPRPVEQAAAQQTPITAPKDNLLGAGPAGQLRR